MGIEISLGLRIAVGLTLLAVAFWTLRMRRDGTRLPLELQRAELFFAEQQFRASGTMVLHAKVDRAYRRRDGVFVLLELKTRRRRQLYASDIIELSVQRVALAAETRMPVAKHGYVLIRGPDGRQLTCRRVRLLDDAEVLELAERRLGLLNGEVAPRANGAPHLCPSCAQFERCSASARAH